jgi:hypothetical protein
MAQTGSNDKAGSVTDRPRTGSASPQPWIRGS